jgi:hypothetical protein
VTLRFRCGGSPSSAAGTIALLNPEGDCPMAAVDQEALREKYLATPTVYTNAAEKTRAELGEVRPIGNGPVPKISPAWIEVMEAEREAHAAHEAARDAYWEAVNGR